MNWILIGVGQPFIGTLLKKRRFHEIHKNLHFSSNETADRTDKLFKIRAIVEILQTTFQENWNPSQHLIVDETMVPFKVGKIVLCWILTVNFICFNRGELGFVNTFQENPLILESKSGALLMIPAICITSPFILASRIVK